MPLCALQRLWKWMLRQVDEGKSVRGGVLSDVARPGCNIFRELCARCMVERVIDAVVGFAAGEILWARGGVSG